MILNTDWMGLSLHLLDDVRRAPSGYHWQEYEGGTNVWGARRVLYNDHGERVLTLLSQPKSSIHDGNAALVEISNEWLYHGIGVDGCLKLLKRCVPFDVSGISRLDLACDFVPSDEQRNVIEQLASGSMYVAGKRSGSGFWSINADEWMPEVWRSRKIPHCISWGHKTSDVKWKLYYKSKELHDAAGGKWFEKPYIVDQWRINNMDVENVWRLEVSIKHGSKLEFRGEPITLDVWRENRTLLWHSFYRSRFIIRKSEGHADKRNDEEVYFLPSYEAGDMKCVQYDGEQVRSARIALLRKLVQSCEEPEVYMDEPTRKSVIGTVTGMVQRDGLSHYFRGMTGLTLGEWTAQVEAKGGDGTMQITHDSNMIAMGLKPNSRFDEQND